MISIQTARSFLGWTPDMGKGAVDQLTMCLNSTISQFERGTSRLWKYRASNVQEVETEKLTEDIFLQLYPVTVISLTEFALDPADAVAVVAADYTTDLETGVVRKLRASSWKRFVRITSTGGYDNGDNGTNIETHIDGYDIVRAILLEVRRSIERDAPETIIHTSFSGEGGSTGLVDTKLRHPEFERCIKRHRRNARNH